MASLTLILINKKIINNDMKNKNSEEAFRCILLCHKILFIILIIIVK